MLLMLALVWTSEVFAAPVAVRPSKPHDEPVALHTEDDDDRDEVRGGAPKLRPAEFRTQVVEKARQYLKKLPKGFRGDCSGYVSAVLHGAGLEVSGGTRHIFAQAKKLGRVHHHKRPRPGDLVFFDNTWDSDKDGRWNDPLSHIGVVLSVDPDGTVTFAHGGMPQGRTTGRLNLFRPHDLKDHDGKALNDQLRRPRGRDPHRARYLSGELFRGFATLDPRRFSREDR